MGSQRVSRARFLTSALKGHAVAGEDGRHPGDLPSAIQRRREGQGDALGSGPTTGASARPRRQVRRVNEWQVLLQRKHPAQRKPKRAATALMGSMMDSSPRTGLGPA